MSLGWFRKTIRELERSWWYIGYAYSHDNKMTCSGIIYTLTTQDFNLVAILKDLEKRHETDSITILSWQRVTPARGANLAKYFQARLDLMAAKLGGTTKTVHLALVKMPPE